MIERGDQLQKLLRQWEVPQPGASLDSRVRTSIRRERARRAARWLPLAAGIVLAAGVAMHWLPRSAAGGGANTLETTTNATGYRPIPEGEITVVKEGKAEVGGKQ